jgi:PAS domain S-box-containing protein
MTKISILLIEDDLATTTRVVKALLRQIDNAVINVFHNVVEAVQQRPDADILLVNVAVFEPRLAQAFPEVIKIGLLAEHSHNDALLAQLDAGFDDLAMLTPAGLAVLGRRIAEMSEPWNPDEWVLLDQLAAENSQLGVIAFDAGNYVSLWNKAAAEHFGVSQQWVLNRHIDKLPLTSTDLSRIKDVLDQARGTEAPFVINPFVLDRHLGKPGSLQLHAYPAQHEHGRQIYLISVWQESLYAEPAQEALTYNQELQILLEANRKISSQLELQPTLLQAVEQTKSLFFGDNCQIYLLERDNRTLRPVLAIGPLASTILKTPLSLTESIMGSVATRGHAATVTPESSGLPYPPTEQIMCCPLSVARGTIGLMVVSRRNETFTTDELRFFESLVQQASLAINNARLFEETRRSLTELSILYSASSAMASQWEDQDVLNTMIEQVVEAMNVGIGYIFHWSAEQNIGVVKAVCAGDQRATVLPVDTVVDLTPRNTITKMLQQQRPIFLNDNMVTLDEMERQVMSDNRLRSRLLVPLISKRTAVGWLELGETEGERTFSADEVGFSRTLASQIAVAMQNSHYMQQTRQTLEEATALYRVTSALTVLQDPQAIISTVLQEFLQALDLHQGSVVLFDFYTRQGVVKVHFHDDQPLYEAASPSTEPQQAVLEGFQIPLTSNPVYERLMRARQAVVIDNPGAAWLTKAPVYAPRLNLPPVAGWADVQAFAVLVIPIKIREEIAGALVVENTRHQRPFSRWVISLGQAMADQLGISLQNVQLFEAEYQRREQAETLQEVAAIVSSSLNLSEVLERILDQLGRVIDYDSAAIHLVEGNRRRVIAGRGFAEPEQHIGLVFPTTADTSDPGSLVLNSRQPALHSNISELYEAFKSPIHDQIKSWIGVPLIARDKVIGLISIDHAKINAYTEDDVQLALAFANQVAVALENARLYEMEVKELERELEVAHQIQTTLLPQSAPVIPGLDIAGRIIPARQVGGDFFHFFSTASNQLGIAIGDVSGKGIPAALYMAAGITAIDTQVGPDIPPGELLNRLNRKLYNRLQENRMNIALQIATFTPFTQFDGAATARKNGHRVSLLTLASAGMIAPIAATRNGCRFLPVGALPIGALPGTHQNYTDDVFLIEPDTVIVFTSDGIVEAQNKSSELFGFKRLEETILEIADSRNAQVIVNHLINTVERFAGDVEQHDDMTVVAVVKR